MPKIKLNLLNLSYSSFNESEEKESRLGNRKVRPILNIYLLLIDLEILIFDLKWQFNLSQCCYQFFSMISIFFN